jgi:hypothetical protein
MRNFFNLFCYLLLVATICSCQPFENQTFPTFVSPVQVTNSTAKINVEKSVSHNLEKTTIPSSTATQAPIAESDHSTWIIQDENLARFLPEIRELPREALYSIPNEKWASPHYNQEVIWDWGAEKANPYLQETGRLMGWETSFLRGADDIYSPEQLFCEVISFQSVEGARTALKKFNAVEVFHEDGWKYEKSDVSLGDDTVVMKRVKQNTGGVEEVWYRIAFSYHNFLGVVTGYGFPEDIKPEIVSNVAGIMLSKMQAAPITNGSEQVITIQKQDIQAQTTQVAHSSVENDTRIIIDDNPSRYLITLSDLPGSAGYYLPEDGYSPIVNDELIQEYGAKLGREIIVNTQRLNGWQAEFIRPPDIGKQYPEIIRSEINMYKSIEGAKVAIESYSPYQLKPQEEWEVIEEPHDEGEYENLFILRKRIENTSYFYYRLEFSYKNIQGVITARGNKQQIDKQFLLSLATFNMNRLKMAPLSADAPATPQSAGEDIITGDPEEFILQLSDLPAEGEYYIPTAWWAVNSDQSDLNEEIISDWGKKLGREYVISTGRERGYSRIFYRGNENKNYPFFIYCQVIQYDTVAGPAKLLDTFYDVTRSPYDGWKVVDRQIDLGDQNKIYTQYEIKSTGTIYRWYEIEFAYKNFIGRVFVRGYEWQVTHDFVENLARTILTRMKSAE